MTIQRMLAQMTVTDLDDALEWYGRLFDTEPDARPMPGLAEWYLSPTFGVQVWADPERAGRSTMVLDETDLDARGDSLAEAGLAHESPQPGGSARILPIHDPDGNMIVFTGA